MVFHQLWPNTQKALGPTTSGGFIEVNNCLIWCSTAHKPFGSTFVPPSLVNWRAVQWYKAPKVQKYALNSQLQALQILTNDDEVENWSLSSFLLAVSSSFPHCSKVKSYV